MTSTTAKIRRQGGSLAVTLPKAMTDALNLQEGDDVHLTQSAEGIVVSPYDSVFEQAMAIGDECARRYRNALKTLADS